MLNIVLIEPEIPQNVGNIARSCVGFNTTLHLIKPYGFFFDINKNKQLSRSGCDYWKDLKYIEYDSFDDFLEKNNSEKNRFYYITRYGIKNPDEANMKTKEEVYVIFGKESVGINKDILIKNKENTIRIPSSDNVRSLNLSNCVAILAYEYLRQNKYEGLCLKEPHKPIF